MLAQEYYNSGVTPANVVSWVLALAGIGLCIFVLYDVLRRPEWVWPASGQSKTLWIVLAALGIFPGCCCGIVGVIIGAIYLASIRSKLDAVQSGGGYGGGGYGGPGYGPPPGPSGYGPPPGPSGYGPPPGVTGYDPPPAAPGYGPPPGSPGSSFPPPPGPGSSFPPPPGPGTSYPPPAGPGSSPPPSAGPPDSGWPNPPR